MAFHYQWSFHKGRFKLILKCQMEKQKPFFSTSYCSTNTTDWWGVKSPHAVAKHFHLVGLSTGKASCLSQNTEVSERRSCWKVPDFGGQTPCGIAVIVEHHITKTSV